MATTANPTYTEQVQSNIPAWMQKYADPLLGMVFGDPSVPGSGLMNLGYQPYMVAKRDAQGNILKDDKGQPILEEGQRVAEFSPLQQRAFQNLAGMGISPELARASQMASSAGQKAAGLSYNPLAAENYYTSPTFERGNVGFERTTGPSLADYQMGPAERVGAERFGLGAMQEYMSPYMQGVVDRQKQAAIQDYMRQIPGTQAASARSGARGGTRDVLMQAEGRRNLANQLGDIQAGGLQKAYEQAAGQFGQDRAAMLQAALANQQAGLTTGQQNLAARLQTQGLGANLGLQSQQLNQSAQLQAQQQALAQLAAANQFAQQNAQQRAQYGLAGANLAEQSRQFGANFGLSGIQQQLAAAGALGGLGMQQYQQGMGINQALLGAGGQQQALNQQLLNTQYQDFLNQQLFPYKQAEFGMGMLRGVPSTTTTSFYQQPGNLFGQIAGSALGVGSLFGGLGQTTGGP